MTPAPPTPAKPPTPQAAPVYLAHGISRAGGRDLPNADAAYRISSDPNQAGQAAAKNRGLLLAVAEGTGDPATAPLRKLVLDQIVKSFNDIPPDIDRRTVLRTAFENANAAARSYLLANPNLGRVGVLAAAAIIKGDVVHVGQIGTCRAYLVGTDGAVTVLTRDHTIGQQHLERGVKKEAVAQMPDANSLTRWLGMADGIVPDLQGPLRLNAGDRLVLTSRGLHAAVEDYQIGLDVTNRSPADGVRRLMNHTSKAAPAPTATALAYGPTAAKRLPALPLAVGGLVAAGLVVIGGVVWLSSDGSGQPGAATATPRNITTIAPTSVPASTLASTPTVVSAGATATPKPTIAPSPTIPESTKGPSNRRTPETTSLPVVVTTITPTTPVPTVTDTPKPPDSKPPDTKPPPPPD